MSVRDAILKKILGLAENEGVQAGEKALTRGAAEKAAIEGSLTNSAADKAALNEVQSSALPSKYDQMSYDLNGLNDAGFSNKPKVFGPNGNPIDSVPNFETVGAPRTEIPADSQSQLMSKFPDQAPKISTPNFEMVGEPKPGIHPDSQAYGMGGEAPQVDLPSNTSKYDGPLSYDTTKGNSQYAQPLSIKTMTPEQKLALLRGEKGTNFNYASLASGGAGALGLGAMAAMPNSTDNKMSGDDDQPPMGTGGLVNLPGFPSQRTQFQPSDLLVDKPKDEDRQPANEEQPEQKAPVKASSAPSEDSDEGEDDSTDKTPKKSDSQALADLLQAQNPPGEESFADVQKRKNLAILANELGSAGDIIGSAIGGQGHIGPNEAAQKLFKNNIEQAGNITKDYQERKAMEEQDPNSAVSKNYRDFLKRYGIDAGPGITAAQIKNVLLPAAEKDQLKKSQLDAQKFNAEQNRLSRESIADENRKSHEFIAEENRKGREALAKAANEKQATTLAKRQLEMAKNRALSGGGMAANRVRNRIAAAENIFGTVGIDNNIDESGIDKLDKGQLDKIPRPMVAELAVEMNAMLSPAGVPPQSTFKKLLPNNIAMDKASVRDYVTNRLSPAQQSEFVKLTLKTAARIKRNSQKQNARLMGQYFSGTNHIREHLPEDYNDAVKSLGLNPDDLMANGSPKKSVESAAPHGGMYPPGSIVDIGGKRYKVGDDGDSLTEQ